MNAHYRLRDALKTSPSPGNLAAAIAKFADVELEFYQPKGVDPQDPHGRDEIYLIARGSGVFQLDEKRFPFAAGDVIYVPVNVEHRFAEFTDDFATWVLFF